MHNAKQEAALIKNKAQEDAKQKAEAKIAQKREELNIKYKDFVVGLDEEKINLRNSLLSQVPLFKESLKAKLGKL